MTVEAQIPAGAFETSVELKVQILDMNSEETGQVMNAVMEKLAELYGDESGIAIAGAYVADISFQDAEGNEVEPNSAVKVTVISDPVDINIPKETGITSDVCQIYHVTDEEVTEIESGEILLDEDNRFIGMNFESDAFSPFAAVILDRPAILDTGVCKIDTTEYKTLSEALNAVPDGETIHLLENVELPEQTLSGKTFTLDLDDKTVALKGQLKISAGADITLKGTGSIKIDTFSPSGRTPIVVEEGTKLTIDGITLDAENTTTLSYISSSEAAWIKTKGTLVLDNGTLKNVNCSGTADCGVILVDGENASFTMNGGNICNNIFEGSGLGQGSYIGAVRVSGGASFTMNGGTINNNDLSTILWSAAVYVDSTDGSSSFVMNGGTISDNHSNSGGGVFVGAPDLNYTYIASFTMNDGTISGNQCEKYAGGVFVCGGGKAVMNNGQITDNTGGGGGGVATYDRYADYKEEFGESFTFTYTIEDWSTTYNVPASFEMNGGVISNNKTISYGPNNAYGGVGGGIYVASNTVVLNAGEIKDNTADKQGGGVYVGSVPYELHMYNTLVKDNKASILGGGIWSCPTGDVRVYVKDGGAVFGNTASISAAGDDFVSIPRSADHITTLADYMLGGGKVSYYKDGGVTANSGDLGTADLNVPRYNLTGDNEAIINISNTKDSYALKAIADEDAKSRAERSAKLTITGNSAPRGGGIGTNGSIVIGTDGEVGALEVSKKVEGTAGDKTKAFTFTVTLSNKTVNGDYCDITFKDGIATFTLKDGECKAATNLPAGVTYEVTEQEANQDGYTTEQTGTSGTIEADKMAAAVFTNTKNETPKPQTGNLTVSKKVEGTAGDKTKAFTFTVVLSDKTVNGVYGDMSFKNGTAEFTLKDGESRTASGLPVGTAYETSEKEANQDGYITAQVGTSGTIEKDKTATAVFINTKNNKDNNKDDKKDDGSHKHNKGDSSSGAGSTDKSPTNVSAPSTGDSSNPVLWIIFILIAVFGVIGITLTIVKHKIK